MSEASYSVFVATGDSFTEGLEDETGPSGRHLGWADRVADALAVKHPGLRYANLAIRGRVLDQVVDEQLPVALAAASADDVLLVSFHAGPNDALRPRADLPDLLRRYDAAVAGLGAEGANVLLFTVIPRAGGSGRTAARLAARFETFNAAVRETASRHGCLLVDAGSVPALQDRRLWHEDRLHLVREGHRRVAAAVLEALGEQDPALLGGPVGWWRVPLPSRTPHRRTAALAADLRWAGVHLAPWVGRRLRGVSSGDGVPAKRPTADPVSRQDEGPG
ncbi:MAG TPA: SGNH/GDSL hydrolase family protein [Candidatus Limnocylindria bacterium]|nr:SGNH/GDSL hydrolase family protein [Candidatus Limnocylindria bacterium]